jgi:uncharacterized protein
VQRDAFIDQLRGFALLGIAIANAPAFAFREGGYAALHLNDDWSRGIAFFVLTFITAKFYSIFAFLFGYSTQFNLQLNQYRRRLLFLAGVGVLHGCLLFFGEIVLLYAILGYVLQKFFAMQDRLLWFWASALTVLVALTLLYSSLTAPLTVPPTVSIAQASPNSVYAMIGLSPFWQAAAARAPFYFMGVAYVLFSSAIQILAMFLIGLIAARQNWFSRELQTRQKALRWLWVWAVIALAVAFWFATTLVIGGVDNRFVTVAALTAEAAHVMATPILALAWIFLLFGVSQKWPTLLAFFAASGRSSLSCYVLQSIIFAVVFSAWGYGLFARLNVFQVLLVSLAVWGLSASAIELWLLRFKRGPLEALLSRWVRYQP